MSYKNARDFIRQEVTDSASLSLEKTGSKVITMYQLKAFLVEMIQKIFESQLRGAARCDGLYAYPPDTHKLVAMMGRPQGFYMGNPNGIPQAEDNESRQKPSLDMQLDDRAYDLPEQRRLWSEAFCPVGDGVRHHRDFYGAKWDYLDDLGLLYQYPVETTDFYRNKPYGLKGVIATPTEAYDQWMGQRGNSMLREVYEKFSDMLQALVFRGGLRVGAGVKPTSVTAEGFNVGSKIVGKQTSDSIRDFMRAKLAVTAGTIYSSFLMKLLTNNFVPNEQAQNCARVIGNQYEKTVEALEKCANKVYTNLYNKVEESGLKYADVRRKRVKKMSARN